MKEEDKSNWPMVLSFLLPGLGHLYKGLFRGYFFGVIWMFLIYGLMRNLLNNSFMWIVGLLVYHFIIFNDGIFDFVDIFKNGDWEDTKND